MSNIHLCEDSLFISIINLLLFKDDEYNKLGYNINQNICVCMEYMEEKKLLVLVLVQNNLLYFLTLMIHNDTKDYHHVIQGALKDLDKKQQQKRKRKRTKKETSKVHWGAQVEFELGDCYLDFSLSDQQRYVPMAFRRLQVFLTNNDLQEDDRDDDNS